MFGVNIFNFIKKRKKVIYHVGAWSGNFGDSILQQSIKLGLSNISRFDLVFLYINCQQTEFTKELIWEINNKADLIIIGGGGLVFYRPQDNSKSGWQWNIDLDLIDMIKVPFVVYGIGYNQFEYDASNYIPITNQHLQKTVQLAALFSVRNSGTKAELIARGCNASKIEVIPDSGMFLTPKHVTIPKLDKTKLIIGFNWTTDREHQTFPPPVLENKEKFISNCLDLLNYAISKKNAQVVYIGHMSSDFDKEIINKLKNGLIQTPIIIDEEISHIYPPTGENAGFLVDVYRQMDIVLGMRGHANIVSFGQNTPFIGLGSHRKIRYFLQDIGRSEYFFDVRTEGNLYSIEYMKKSLDDLIKNIPTQKIQMKRELYRQKGLFNNFNRKIINILETT